MVEKNQIDNQLKTAEVEKIKAETERTRFESKKLELESNILAKNQSEHWIKKKEFWAILIGSLIAWTAVGFYIGFGAIPAMEYHNEEVKLENKKNADSIYDKERQLKLAYDTLKARQEYLVTLTNATIKQKNEISRLHFKVDSIYSAITRLKNSNDLKSRNEIKDGIEELKKYIEDYKSQQKRESFTFPLISQSLLPKQSDNFQNSLADYKPVSIGVLPRHYWDSIIDQKSDQPFSTNLGTSGVFSGSVEIRPLFNGTEVKDLTIHVIVKNLTTIEEDINYSTFTGYRVNGFLSGTLSFTVKGDEYRIKAIYTSPPTLIEDNNVHFTSYALGDKKIDLILEKK